MADRNWLEPVDFLVADGTAFGQWLPRVVNPAFNDVFEDALAMGNNLLGDDVINHSGLAQGQLQHIPGAAGFHYALAESAFYLGAKFGSATGIWLGDTAGAVRVSIEEKTGAVANGMVVSVH